MPNNIQIIVKLRGGLGNQMFQYAYAKKVAGLYPKSQLILDTSYFNCKHIRNLEIDQYNLADNVSYSATSSFTGDKAFVLYKIFYKFTCRKFTMPAWLIKRGFWYENNDFVIPNPLPTNLRCVYMGGYFQNEPEIRSIYTQLVRDFTPKQPLSAPLQALLTQINTTPNTVGISIRLGKDYQQLGWPICQKAFYLAGLKELQKHITPGKIFVFSDEIERIKTERWFKGYDAIFVPVLSPVESLELLRACKHFVISNSTFAWWGAYLGQEIGKKIIAPIRFYGKGQMPGSTMELPQAIYLDNVTGTRK